jgi:hypothetical protein
VASKKIFLLYLINAAYDFDYITFAEFLELLAQYKIEWTQDDESIDKLIITKIVRKIGSKPIAEIDRFLRSLRIRPEVAKQVIRLKIRSDPSWYGDRQKQDKILGYAKYIFDKEYLNGQDQDLNKMFHDTTKKHLVKKNRVLGKQIQETVPYLLMDPVRIKQYADKQIDFFTGGQHMKQSRRSFCEHLTKL